MRAANGERRKGEMGKELRPCNNENGDRGTAGKSTHTHKEQRAEQEEKKERGKGEGGLCARGQHGQCRDHGPVSRAKSEMRKQKQKN